MLASGEIAQRGAIRQELDVPAERFISEITARGVNIEFSEHIAVTAPAEPGATAMAGA
jgi:hypothetical protein